MLKKKMNKVHLQTNKYNNQKKNKRLNQNYKKKQKKIKMN